MSNAWIIECRNRMKFVCACHERAEWSGLNFLSRLLHSKAAKSKSRIGARLLVRSRNGFRLANNDSGVAAIEFAIVLPVFLILICGILSYGIYFGAAHSVAQLAADAARVSVAGLDDAERTSLATAHINANASGFAFLDRNKITVVTGPSPANPAQFTVDVRFDSSSLPIWLFSDLLPLPSKIIERSSTIRRGGQ